MEVFFFSLLALADSDSDLDFKTSDFETKFKTVAADDLVKVNALLTNEGLTYKAHLKELTRAWSVCSTVSADDTVCHQATVGFKNGEDTCGKFGLFDVLAQSTSQWVVTTGNTPFRVHYSDYLLPIKVVLQKSEAIIRDWSLPQNFTPAFLSLDLRTLVLKANFSKTPLYLEVSETGRIRFIPAPTKYISLSDKEFQDVRTLDGSRHQLMLPKKCL